MNGLVPFLAKELREISRTWRIWVLPSVVVFFAATGPPSARFAPELLSSALGPGAVPLLPTPTYLDAYLQWTKNLGQLVLFIIIVMLGGVVSGESRQGTAALVLTSPLTRPAFLTAKMLASAALVTATTAVGMGVTWLVTLAFFGEAPLPPLLAATAGWLALAVLFVAIMVLASALVTAAAGAAGLGFAGFLVLAVAGLWGWAARFTPAGLIAAPDRVLRGEPVDLVWPLVTTGLLAAVLVGTAIVVFGRREL